MSQKEQLNLTSAANPFDRWFEMRKTPSHPEGESIMSRLFDRLDGAYPHKWRSNFPNQQAIDNWSVSWTEAFEEEGIKPEDIKAGLKACRNRFDWPPSCAEFVKACKPEEPEINALTAYYQAVAGITEREQGRMGKWSHPAIYWASSKMAFDLKHQTYSQMKIRWEEEFNAQMSRGEWEPIPEPMIALPAPGKAQLSKEGAAKMMEQLGASGILKAGPSDTAWYRKILARFKKGDKTLMQIQIRFAQEAAKAHGYVA